MAGRRAQVARVVDLGRKLRRDGARATTARLALQVHDRLAVPDLQGLLRDGDLAVSSLRELPAGPVVPRGTPATIGWLCSPPHAGSGGHTTFFRMVRGMQERGHRCVVFLYDAYGGDPARLETHMRTHWPDLAVEYRDPSRGIDGVDACVASSWETAHVLATRGGTTPMHRLYFIQDFEPYFFPRGSHYALAAASYRLPFRRIALGGSIAEILDREVGVGADVVPFGCDRDVYRLLDAGAERSGVVFFARTGAPRRGYLVGMLALQEFHRRHPEQEIHLFGDPVASPPFPATAHGRLTPRELNALYNQTIGGLALSFTNVTLVAGEMLAAGNIPVANENAFARGGLRDDQVVWAEESPDRLAEALAAVVEHPDISTRAAAAAGGGSTTWADTQRAFAQIVEAELAQDLPGEAAVDLSPAGAALRQ